MSVVIRGRFRKPQARLLRSYERIAHIQHECDDCELPILPGEEYIGEVWVTEMRDYGTRNKLNVTKKHLHCPEDPAWMHDYEEERDRDYEAFEHEASQESAKVA